MVDVEQLVDPELEGLLRELGSRPRSVFLRTSRKDAMRVLRSRTTEPISGMGVSDALERELVTVHRTELAEILKQACRTKLLEGERERLFIMHYRTATERVDAVPLVAIGERYERAQCAGVSEPWLGAMASIGQALSARSVEDLSVLELAAVGQRLVPRDSWRTMSALSLNANRMNESACELATSVLDGWPQLDEAILCLEVLAVSETTLGSPLRALRIQEQACDLNGDYERGELNRIRFAAFALREQEFLDASDRLDAIIDSKHPLVQQALESTILRRQAGEWNPSAESVRFVRTHQDRLGPTARRITSAFL